MMDYIGSIIVLLVIGVASFLFGRSQVKKANSSSDPMDYTTTFQTLKEKAKRDQEKAFKEVDNADRNTLRRIISDNVSRLLGRK